MSACKKSESLIANRESVRVESLRAKVARLRACLRYECAVRALKELESRAERYRAALCDARAAAPQPVSAAEVPMPDAIGRLYFGGVSCGERDEWEFDADQGVCDGINESATEESRQRVYLHRDVLTYGVQCRAAGYAAGVAAAQTLHSLRELAAEADAALRGEVT